MASGGQYRHPVSTASKVKWDIKCSPLLFPLWFPRNVELPFHWQLVRSSPECRDPFREGKKDGQQISRVADERNIFCINMEKGVLPPSGTAVTSVAFAPPKVHNFCCLCLIVLCIKWYIKRYVCSNVYFCFHSYIPFLFSYLSVNITILIY